MARGTISPAISWHDRRGASALPSVHPRLSGARASEMRSASEIRMKNGHLMVPAFCFPYPRDDRSYATVDGTRAGGRVRP